MSLYGHLKAGGRKYAVVVRTLELATLVTLTAILVVAVVPTIGPHVAAIVGTFGIFAGIAVGSYNGANAAADWHTTPKAPTPPPRQSGTFPEPP